MSYPSRMSFLFSLVLVLPLTCSSRASAASLRRLLHQPLFFPLDSFPPSASPQPQPQPKIPSSSATPQTQLRPFFPDSASASCPPPPVPPTPPPPSPYLVTFPANISALLLPTTPSSSNSSFSRRRLAAVVVSITLLSVALLSAVSALILIHRRRRNEGGFSDDKSLHADGLRLVPPNTSSSSDAIPPPSVERPPHYVSTSSSSEFLNLGTFSSSNPYVDVAQGAATSGVDLSTSAQMSYQKPGSPELRPLPPLPRVPTNLSGETPFSDNNEGTKKEEDRDDEREDEFFSPRGSSSYRDSPGSPDLQPALNLQRESEFLSKFGSRSLNSRKASYPYAAPIYGSSQNSASSSGGNVASLQMEMDSSRISLRSRSPEPILKFLAPTNVSVPRSMPMNSPTLLSSTSSPQSGSEMHKSRTFNPTTPITHPARRLPPWPPSVPTPRSWENPISQNPIAGPPVLVAPSQQEFRRSRSGGMGEKREETPRLKLKPLQWDWDKVRASSDTAMVCDHIESTSFQLYEEMIETLFMANGSTPKDGGWRLLNQENRVLDPKKSQNIAILLKSLNVTVDEVCEYLMEGSADSMGSELLESLLKMAPTKEEERKLIEVNDESSVNFPPAEKFLKALLNVPFAFKRVDAMLYIAYFEPETEYLRRSFKTVKAACVELRNSKLFSRILEAVLKIGNRMNVGMNRGDAQPFKLDMLLKLVDVKDKDGRTTLLHFVVQEIVRIEGSGLSKDYDQTNQSSLEIDAESRKLGLQVVSGLSVELANVKIAASMDSCVLSNEVVKLADGLARVKEVLRMCCDETKDDRWSKFAESMRKFILKAGEEITCIQAEGSAVLALVREATEYFHGDSSGKEEAHPFQIFLIVKDFLAILDKVCEEVGRDQQAAKPFPVLANPSVPPLFPGFGELTDIAPPGDDYGRR